MSEIHSQIVDAPGGPPLKDAPVVVVGASGFVGAHLCAALNQVGLRPLAAVRTTSQLERHRKMNVDARVHAIDDATGFAALFGATPRIVVNCATAYARNGEARAKQAVEDNVLLPLRLLSATGPDCAFVQLDTFSAVDPKEHSALPEYHLSKRQLRQWLALEDKRTVVQVRLEHVYGPLDAGSKFVSFVLRSLQDNVDEIELTEGKARRDFVHVHDVASALSRIVDAVLAKTLVGHHTLELGTGSSTPVREFVAMAKEITGANTELQFGKRAAPTSEIQESKADLKGWSDLGWQPTIALSDGIRSTLSQGVSI